MTGTKSSLPREKRVKYTQYGLVHSSIALEHDFTHTEVPGIGYGDACSFTSGEFLAFYSEN
jgi:hypothetical protein